MNEVSTVLIQKSWNKFGNYSCIYNFCIICILFAELVSFEFLIKKFQFLFNPLFILFHLKSKITYKLADYKIWAVQSFSGLLFLFFLTFKPKQIQLLQISSKSKVRFWFDHENSLHSLFDSTIRTWRKRNIYHITKLFFFFLNELCVKNNRVTFWYSYIYLYIRAFTSQNCYNLNFSTFSS